jgi:hypothetical protein
VPFQRPSVQTSAQLAEPQHQADKDLSCVVIAAAAAAHPCPVVTTVEAAGFTFSPDNTEWSLACPEGTWMFGVDIAGDPAINAIGPIYCTTAGQGRNVSKTGMMAGSLPVPVILWREYGSGTGYSSISMRKSNETDVIAAISFTYGPGMGGERAFSAGMPSQAYGGIGGAATTSVACPRGQIVTGLYGETNGVNIFTIGATCQQSSGAAAGRKLK